MKIPTLEEFLTNDMDRSWVAEEGFRALYVRKGQRYVTDVDKNVYLCNKILTLASMDAKRPGKGAFKALIAKLEKIWDGTILIENVLTMRFALGIMRLGFVRVDEHLSGNSSMPEMGAWNFAKKLGGPSDILRRRVPIRTTDPIM